MLLYSFLYIYLLFLHTLLHFSHLCFSTCIFVYFHICIFLYFHIFIVVYFHIFIHFCFFIFLNNFFILIFYNLCQWLCITVYMIECLCVIVCSGMRGMFLCLFIVLLTAAGVSWEAGDAYSMVRRTYRVDVLWNIL